MSSSPLVQPLAVLQRSPKSRCRRTAKADGIRNPCTARRRSHAAGVRHFRDVDPPGRRHLPLRHFSATEADPHPGDDFNPDLNLLDDPLWPLLAHRIPALEQLRLQRAWAGHYDQCLLDHNAVIGPLPGIPNLFVASGFSGHGVQHGPATGRALAELIASADTRHWTFHPWAISASRITSRCRKTWSIDTLPAAGTAQNDSTDTPGYTGLSHRRE